MREFYQNFGEIFGKGLRAEKSTPRNKQFLSECKNVLVGRAGLIPKHEMIQPISAEINWPFPRLVKTEKFWLLMDSDAVYEVDVEKGTKTSVLTTDEFLSWHWADFIDYVVLTNGREVYVRNPTTSNFEKPANFPFFKTCCNFRGQLFVGNLADDFYGCDSSFVAFSNIGSAEFEPDRKNEAGYRPAKVGDVFAVKPLQSAVIAYGSQGVRAFIPVNQSHGQFAERHLADFGIASRDAIGGDETSHVFVDDKGDLWMIDNELKIQKLGYKEFLGEMLGTPIVISHNSNPGEFYISDGEKCFVLRQGLSQVSELPTGVNFYNGELVAVYETDDEPGFLMSTVGFDFGWRSFKKITSLEFGVDCDVQLYASVDWRKDYKGNWRSSGWKRINQVGSAAINVQGTEFKMKLKTNDPANVNLDHMTARFQWGDRRFIRGEAQNVG